MQCWLDLPCNTNKCSCYLGPGGENETFKAFHWVTTPQLNHTNEWNILTRHQWCHTTHHFLLPLQERDFSFGLLGVEIVGPGRVLLFHHRRGSRRRRLRLPLLVLRLLALLLLSGIEKMEPSSWQFKLNARNKRVKRYEKSPNKESPNW